MSKYGNYANGRPRGGMSTTGLRNTYRKVTPHEAMVLAIQLVGNANETIRAIGIELLRQVRPYVGSRGDLGVHYNNAMKQLKAIESEFVVEGRI